MAGHRIDVALEGASSFTLTSVGLPEGVIERVDFNQSDWADAQVELMDGQKIRLGNLPVAPLGTAPPMSPPFSFPMEVRTSGLSASWDKNGAQRLLPNQQWKRY